MKIDIELVYEIIQDFTNKEISLKDKQGDVIWNNTYQSEATFNKVFREINNRFSQEIRLRNNKEVKL